ncbi:Histone-lysine N-methyltransferase E(z) [Halotydeus destructor]|nr:Histone-lysine N-methyltransferase E(z) [Halotydeus destructor]
MRTRMKQDENENQSTAKVKTQNTVVVKLATMEKTEDSVNPVADCDEVRQDDKEESMDDLIDRVIAIHERIQSAREEAKQGIIKAAQIINRKQLNQLLEHQAKTLPSIKFEFSVIPADNPKAKLARASLCTEESNKLTGLAAVNCRLPPLARLPITYQFAYAPRNCLIEDEKVLHHIPYLGDALVTDATKEAGVVHDLMQSYEFKIHDDGEKIEDEDFLKVIEDLSSSSLDRPVLKNRTTRKSGNVPDSDSVAVKTKLPMNTIFEAVSRTFSGEGSPADVCKRYNNLILRNKPKTAYCPNMDGPEADCVPRSRALNSFKTLFCRRCLMYDCLMHSEEMDMSREMASTVVIRKDAFVAKAPMPVVVCGNQCAKENLDAFPKSEPMSEAAQTVINAMWSSMSYNYCTLTEVVKPIDETVTCSAVARWCVATFGPLKPVSPKKAAVAEPSSSVPVVIKRKPKTKKQQAKLAKSKASLESKLQAWQKMASRHLSRTKVVSHNYKPCTPCEDHLISEDGHAYHDKCTANCHCVKNGTFCEKFCMCPPDCPYRFPGCKCSAQCATKQCPCYAASRECDPDRCGPCKAGSLDKKPNSCNNIGIQRLARKHLLVAPSDLGKKAGWGCFAKEKINKNELISEYCGEVISQSEADRRGIIYDERKQSFLFGLNNEFAVDATRKGNKIRFANHSNNPNCYAKIMKVIGEHRIGIYAKRDIETGEEIFFDYKYGANAVDFVPIERKRDRM